MYEYEYPLGTPSDMYEYEYPLGTPSSILEDIGDTAASFHVGYEWRSREKVRTLSSSWLVSRSDLRGAGSTR